MSYCFHRVITVFTVFRLLTDFVCLYNYEFGLSLCKIVRSSVILLLPLFTQILLWRIVIYNGRRKRRGGDCMVVGFTITCAIRAYRHESCVFESRVLRGVLHTTLYDKVC